MADVVEALTVDERAVLEIAASGVPMMEIGRWEKSVLSLERKGYLAGPKFNKSITDAGQAAFEAQEAETGRRLGEYAQVAKRIADVQQEVAQIVAQAAALMAHAAVKTHEIRGDGLDFALEQWTKQMVEEARIMMQEVLC